MNLRLTLQAAALLCCAIPSLAQGDYDTLRVWRLDTYSQTTLSNIAADTGHWTMNKKGGRYQNAVATDGNLLTANGVVIEETRDIYFPAGIKAGYLLLCFNRGTSGNGVQDQTSAPITIKNLKKGQVLELSLRSSSSSNNGIKAAVNLTGDIGSDNYTGPDFKKFTFKVIADGDVSFTPSGGVIIKSILLLHEEEGAPVATPVITVSGKTATITCATEGASIVYSTVDHGTVWDYERPYTGPIELSHSVRLRAAATKEGMHSSGVAEERVDIPLVMPFEKRPFVLAPEKLSRGAIATMTDNGVLVSWRWLVDDVPGVAFNVLRNGKKLNDTPITTKTNWLDKEGTANDSYTVQTVSDGAVSDSYAALSLAKGYLDIPLDRPANGKTEDGEYMYVPGDCMVADVDGDGEYEVVMKWDPSSTDWNPSDMSKLVNDVRGTAGQKDNSLAGRTGSVLIDAYKMDGTKLWRIDLGRNIRAGAHYTQLMVYDLDGDGKAEVACKTAPGTIDGKGVPVLMGSDSKDADYRNSSGQIIKGPEYLTVFSGLTGEQLATTAYRPARDTVAFGDSYGNRSERYLACVAYLDGQHPSLVMCRGYYTSAFLWAVDFDGHSLKTHWLHSSTKAGYGAYGEGAHALSVADVDGDGRDEIIYGSCAVDDDGQLLYRTGLGHGDALHVGDLMPDRPGLEVMMVHETTSAEYGVEMHDALTGEHLSGTFAGKDVGRGLCADVDSTSRGCEYWSTLGSNVYDCNGTVISTKRPSVNFRTYWDGDIYEEMTEKGAITKYTSRTTGAKTLVNFISKYGAGADLIKYTPCLQADIFGDWREEQIYYDGSDFSHLWIFSTPYESPYRVPCLMQDHQYRMATVWQTSGYNQPPHLSYYLPDYIAVQTGIKEINAVDVETGTDGDKVYSVTGQRLSKPQRGLNIVNGKKVIVK